MAKGSFYTDQQRREAVVHFVLLGNLTKVASATGIPQRTLSDWVGAVWWNTLVTEVHAEKGAELDGVYTQIIEAATAQLIDRVRLGDFVMTKTGLERKPIGARDLAVLSGIIFDKRQLHRQRPTMIEGRGATLQEIADMLLAPRLLDPTIPPGAPAPREYILEEDPG